MFQLESSKVKIIRLEKHTTKDIKDQHVNGSLTVVWRDWDDIIKNHPKMIYVSSVNPGEIKGPHLHTKRDSYFICIHGKVLFIVQDDNGKYQEIESNADEPVMILIPKNYPSAHLNLSKEVSRVLALANIAWRPDDDEMKNVIFEDYDWSKWRNVTR